LIAQLPASRKESKYDRQENAFQARIGMPLLSVYELVTRASVIRWREGASKYATVWKRIFAAFANNEADDFASMSQQR
jgi:hypothetical protein